MSYSICKEFATYSSVSISLAWRKAWWSQWRTKMSGASNSCMPWKHDDVIKWKHFPRYWPFVREIHRSSVNFPHKGQWRGALMFTLICARMNGWVNNREAGDLRRYRVHYDVIVMNIVNRMSKIWYANLWILIFDNYWLACVKMMTLHCLHFKYIMYFLHLSYPSKCITGLVFKKAISSHHLVLHQGSLLLTWINLHPSMD